MVESRHRILVAAVAIALSGCGGTPRESHAVTGTSPGASPTTATVPQRGALSGSTPGAAPARPAAPSGTGAASSSTSGTTTTLQTTSSTAVGEVPADHLAAVLSHASGIAGVDVSSLVVTRAEFVEWSDGSLGCPEPGMLYPQVVTPGYWVEVTHPGGVLDYRLTKDGAIRLCAAGVGADLTTPTTTGGGDS